MPEDRFDSLANSLTAPATRAAAVTPVATGNLPFVSRAIQTRTDGFVDIEMAAGGRVTLWCQRGIPYPLRVARIFPGGTTATGIVILD